MNNDNKVIVNKNYLEALKEGIQEEVIRMWANAEAGFIKLPEIDKLCNEIDTDGPDMSDPRYNVPKEEPKASKELVEKTIEETQIYHEAKNYILKHAQPKQVAYGLDKYPEPLNANTWSTIETIDHIIDESVDKLHYLVMLRIKLEKQLDEKQLDEKRHEATPYNITVNINVDGNTDPKELARAIENAIGNSIKSNQWKL